MVLRSPFALCASLLVSRFHASNNRTPLREEDPKVSVSKDMIYSELVFLEALHLLDHFALLIEFPKAATASLELLDIMFNANWHVACLA